MTQPTLLRLSTLVTLLAVLPSLHAAKPNILFISVDDMSCDSVGAFGCRLADTTPAIDKLASQGMRFEYAHVQVGNCNPSRNVMFSGLYPHTNGVQGFYKVPNPDYPVLSDLMQDAGYFTGIRGKVTHSTPYQPYDWNIIVDELDGKKVDIKNAESYYRSTKLCIDAAADAGKPFCTVVNISDPHKPFWGMSNRNVKFDDPNVPSKIFTADEVPIPGFLFDHPAVREELAHYYTSVRRADDCVAATLRALTDSGEANRTVVVFLSDHGMPLPFAKTYLYHHSTRTPWIVKWPGTVREGSHDTTHMISAIDLLPTLLDIADAKHPDNLQGRSFLPLLKGETQHGRDMVFKEYNENAGGNINPIRGTQDRRFGYLFSPWVNGKRKFRTATQGTATYRTMKKLATSNADIAKRLNLFEFSLVEQFFDYENDPDGLHNLIDDPNYAQEVERHRKALRAWMVETDDHCLAAFDNRHDPAAMEEYVRRMENESAARRSKSRKQKAAVRKLNVLKLTVPESISGNAVAVRIPHKLPATLGTQKLHVTLKTAAGKRIDRKVLEISGDGVASVEFKFDRSAVGKKVTFAAFVGDDYQSNLQHINSRPVPLIP